MPFVNFLHCILNLPLFSFFFQPLVEDFPTGLNNHTILDLPDFLSIEAQSLLTGLLQYEPNDRLGGGAFGSEEIKSHPFFHQVDWDEIYNEL